MTNILQPLTLLYSHFNSFRAGTECSNLLVRLTFKTTIENPDGTQHLLLNWIDRFGVEFRGYACNSISRIINGQISIGNIYSITGATIFYIRCGHSTRIENIKKIRINQHTAFIRVEDAVNKRLDLDFPHIQYNYITDHKTSVEYQWERAIDLIGVYSTMCVSTSIVELFTASACYNVNVKAILPQIFMILPFLKPRVSILSFKGIRPDPTGLRCYHDTILLIDRVCSEFETLKTWIGRQA